MAREIKTITIMDNDKEKTFKIQQMSAWRSQKWLAKLLLLLGSGATSIQSNDFGGLLSAVSEKPFEKVEELLGDLISCCTIVLDGNVHVTLSPQNVDTHVDSLDTILQLEKEAFTHNNFFGGKALNGFVKSQSQEMPTINLPK